MPNFQSTDIIFPNIGWKYYKNYYRPQTIPGRRIDWSFLTTTNEENIKAIKKMNAKNIFNVLSNDITNTGFQQNVAPTIPGIFKNIELKTTYPGLVLGVGYGHKTGSEGEFKIGFYFDYTTGLPTIPGSSIKGTLRSYFPNFNNPKILNKLEKCALIYSILAGCSFNDALGQYSTDGEMKRQIHELEMDTFEGKVREQTKSIYKRDLFYDAIIISGNRTNKIFDNDFITPHPDPLLDPKPIQFLKIVPEVRFQFSFTLFDSHISINGNITADRKEMLFKKLLLEYGIGAKTNVGYGQFT